MHVEKNVTSCLFQTFSSTKGTKADSVAMRHALKELNIMDDLHAIEVGVDDKGNKVWQYAEAPWVWKKHELEQVILIPLSFILFSLALRKIYNVY